MRGIIDRIWENETKDKKTYYVLDIGGERYSLWDTKLLEGISEGSRVEYDWKQSGSYKKITDLRKMDPCFHNEVYRSGSRSIEIIRMSCLRTASEILHGIYIDPDEKTRKAMDIARQLEKYVTGMEDDPNAEEKTRDSS